MQKHISLHAAKALRAAFDCTFFLWRLLSGTEEVPLWAESLTTATTRFPPHGQLTSPSTQRCCQDSCISTTARASPPNQGVSGCSGPEVAVPLLLGIWQQAGSTSNHSAALSCLLQCKEEAAVPSCLLRSLAPTACPAPWAVATVTHGEGAEGWVMRLPLLLHLKKLLVDAEGGKTLQKARLVLPNLHKAGCHKIFPSFYSE